MRWEQQAGQQVGDGAGSPNWALLTTQAHKQHTGWESSSGRLQKQRWPQLPQPRSRKISGGTTVCEVSHQVSPLLISFIKALSKSWNNITRIEKAGKGRESRVQPSLGERVLPRPPVLTHPPLDHGQMDKAVLSPPMQVQQKGPTTDYSPFANAALFRVVHI